MPDDKKPLERVRSLIDHGAPARDAIRIVLGGSIPKWAARHGLARTPATMTIAGQRIPPDRGVFSALMTDLDANGEEVLELLARATDEMRRKAVAVNA